MIEAAGEKSNEYTYIQNSANYISIRKFSPIPKIWHQIAYYLFVAM